MTPIFEEMLLTFCKAADVGFAHIGARSGLRAVIETHFVPMLAKAHAIGSQSHVTVYSADTEYADRIKRLILEPAAPQDEKS